MIRAELTTQINPDPLFRAVERAKKLGSTRQAQAVAERAKASIVRRNRPSQPGETPTDRTGRLRRLIQFAWDDAQGVALAGPALAPSSRPGGDGNPVGSTIPAVLEHGGQIRNVEVRTRRGWVNDTQRLRRIAPRAERRTRTVSVDARPYMAPAMEAEMHRFPEQFRDSIGGN